MSATATFNELATLSDAMSSQDDRIEELREQMRSFQGESDLALPADWNPDVASAELSKLLRDRLRDTNRHRELTAEWRAVKQEEVRKGLAKLEKSHAKTCVEILKSAVALAHAVAEAERIRSEAADIAGRLGVIQWYGPSGGHFSLRATNRMTVPGTDSI
jgi:hypothetical protein